MSLLCAQAPGAASPPVPHLPPSAHPCRAKGAGRKSSNPAVPFLPCAPSSSWKQDTGCFVTLVLRSPGKPRGEIWHRALQESTGCTNDQSQLGFPTALHFPTSPPPRAFIPSIIPGPSAHTSQPLPCLWSWHGTGTATLVPAAGPWSPWGALGSPWDLSMALGLWGCPHSHVPPEHPKGCRGPTAP